MFGCFFDFHILLLPTNARFKVAAFKGKTSSNASD